MRDSKTRRLSLLVLKEIILEEKGGRADDRKVDREVFGGGGSLTLRRLRPSSRRATDWGPQRRLNLGLGCQSCLLPPRCLENAPTRRAPATACSRPWRTCTHILPPTTRIPGEVDGLPTGNLSQSGGRSSNGAAADDL